MIRDLMKLMANRRALTNARWQRRASRLMKECLRLERRIQQAAAGMS